MKELINILDQQFYHLNTTLLDGDSIQFDKCVVIIDESDLPVLLEKSINTIGEKINQIIVVGENVNDVFMKLINKDVFLIAASDFKEAVSYAVINEEESKNIVCISKEVKISKVMESLI